MSFCNQCGTELPDGANFCVDCGAASASRAAATNMAGIEDAAEPAATRDRPSRPGLGQPVVLDSGGRGWILPALVAVAAIIIAYLLFAPKSTRPATGTPQAPAVGEARAPAGTVVAEDRRAVDEASNAATIAGANTRASTSVSAAVLDAAFNSDPAGAALRYPGPIRVSGTIATMVQPGPLPALSLEGRTRFNYMIVEFPEGYRMRLAPLAKGQFVSVACDQVRALAGTTILSQCLLA